jgi:hypothetical protein
MSQATILDVYVVYKDPLDYPGQWVVRHWQVVPEADEPLPRSATIGDSYEAVISAIPPGFIRTLPMQGDVKSIHEVWI